MTRHTRPSHHREHPPTHPQGCRRLALLLSARQAKMLHELGRIYPIRGAPVPHRPTATPNYTIRGVELPLDPGSVGSTREEEEAAASALGYLAHIVALLAKLWGVPLRYPLACRASRSLVHDPAYPPAFVALPFAFAAAPSAAAAVSALNPSSSNDPSAPSPEALLLQAATTTTTATFPLFRRGVERERFAWAVHLLRRDVVQLLAARKMPGHKVAVVVGPVGAGSGGGGGPPRWHLLQAVQALMAHELRMWSSSS